MDVSQHGIDFIAQWERYVPYVYDDFRPGHVFTGGRPRGTLTIGYGHTGKDVKPGMTWTMAQAREALARDVRPAVAAVRTYVKVPLTQNQFDALVSFVFNTGKLRGTTLLKVLNAKEYDRVPTELAKWVKSKGVRLEGLVRRRAAEAQLWRS